MIFFNCPFIGQNGVDFMIRKEMSRKTDKRVFHQTATNTKVINLGVVTYRGGIRL